MEVAFDTLHYAKKLKEYGFTDQQAEGLAETPVELIEDRLATKRDIKELDTTMESVRADLELKIKELESHLTMRLGAMMASSVAIVAALIKLL